jgi:hypothetical protein
MYKLRIYFVSPIRKHRKLGANNKSELQQFLTQQTKYDREVLFPSKYFNTEAN